MKTKTLKKALSIFLAVLMIALALPVSLLTVAAEESAEIKITNVSLFGNYNKSDGGTQKIGDYGSYPKGDAIDGDITNDAQTSNGDDLGYQMCYFDADGVMKNGENANGSSYYVIWIFELKAESVVDTLELWAPTSYLNDRWFTNQGYDIYCSVDGESYTAVDGATFTNVYTDRDSNGYYVAGTYNTTSGYVHQINMNDARATHIAIAVSGLVYERDETIFHEVVVNGTAVPTTTVIDNVSLFGNYKKDDGGTKKIGDYTSFPKENAFDGNIASDAQTSNGDDLGYQMCYFDADGVMKNGENANGLSYYVIWIFELNTMSQLNTFSLWTSYTDRWMANNGYDIWYSLDGNAYDPVDGAMFTNVYTNRDSNGYYVAGTYNSVSGRVHEIDMKGVTAKYIAIAVSGLVYERDETIVQEAVVDGTPIPYVEYDDARDGNLLYEVDFNSEEEGFAFNGTNSGWDSIQAEVSDGGKTVTIKKTGTTSAHRAKYTSKLNKKYPVKGNSYTIQFTVDSKAPVGFLLDYAHGFVINPSTNTTSMGRYEDTDALMAEQTYGGTFASKQTYAIEISFSSEEGMTHDNCVGYAPTVYRLYVRDEATGTWKLIREIDETLGNQFGFEKNYSEYIHINLARYGTDKTTKSKVSDVKIYRGIDFLNVFYTADGASVRLTENSTGLRFMGVVSKNYYDSLKTQYGENNVTLGMLITPTDYLTGNSLEFTAEALDACDKITGVKYLEIDATAVLTEGNNYKVRCAIVNINTYNYDRAFSAVLYVKIKDGDTVSYTYSAYNENGNSRSVAKVAKAAYGDIVDEEGTVKGELTYSYSVNVAGITKYRPYNPNEMVILQNFFDSINAEAGEVRSTVSVLSYNLEQKDDTDGWENRTPAKAVQSIIDSGADVIGIQEDSEDWNDYLAVLKNNGYANLAGNRTYNSSSWGGNKNTWGNGKVFNDIYYKTEKFELVTSGWDSFKNLAKSYTIVGYEDTDMSIDDRGTKVDGEDIGTVFSYVVLRDKETGEVILFVNTHLHYGEGVDADNRDNLEDDDELRAYQSRLLAAWMADKAADYPTQVLIGDMNARENTEYGKNVLSGYSDSGLFFAREEAAVKVDTNGTIVNSDDYVKRTGKIYDHVIFRDAKAYEYTVIDNKIDLVNDEYRYPSDHLPVYAKFSY